MKAGVVEVYVNYPVLVLGSAGDYDLSIIGTGDPATASRSHVAVAVRAQIALVRVTFWSSVRVRSGTIVYSGPLELADGRFYVNDVEGLTRYSRLIGAPGPHNFVIAVDDPGQASRIRVIIDALQDTHRGVEERILGSVEPLAPLGADLSETLEYCLSEYDNVRQRLKLAVDSIRMRHATAGVGSLEYDIRRVAEWLRWIHPRTTFQECFAAAEQIRGWLASPADGVALDRLVSRILQSIEGAADS